MKKLHLIMMLVLTIALLSVSTSSFGRIADGTDYEVRTTGAAGNGGGYYPRGGTSEDLSQQDAAAVSFTDLTTSGVGVTTLTSAIGGFDENGGNDGNIVGNVIHITSGTNATVGFYEITAYTDDNTVTVDRAPDDGVGGLGGDGVGGVGGALDSPEYLEGSLSVGSYTTIFIKSGTYLLGDTWAIQTYQSYDSIIVYGYKDARFDTPLGDDRPLLDANGNVNAISTGITNINSRNVICNIRLTGGTGDCWASAIRNYTYNYVTNCKISNGGDKNLDDNGVDGSHAFYDCEINNATDDGWKPNCDTYWYGVYIHDNGGDGSYSSRCSADCYQEYVTLDTNNGYGQYSAGYYWKLFGCIAYNNQNDGYQGDLLGNTHNSSIPFRYKFMNNIFHDNGQGGAGYGFDNDSSDTLWLWDYNCYEGNATGGLSGVTAGAHDITGDPMFTDPANGDFTFQGSSPCIDAGWFEPKWNGMLGDYKFNIGIDQEQNSTVIY